MMKVRKLVSVLTVSLCLANTAGATEYQGTTFSSIWNQVASDPYPDGVHPQFEVTIPKLFDGLTNLLYEDSVRTLNDKNDTLLYSDKLIHANGVCLKGTWNITEQTPYTGYFQKNSEGLLIARVSTATSNTQRGTERAFGMAGKIYPTQNELHTEPLKTANFFTLDKLGNKSGDYFLDAEITNDILSGLPTLSEVFGGLIAGIVAPTFIAADQSDLSSILIRELYPVAELGEEYPEDSKSPVWLKLVGSSETPRVLENDFRDELAIENYPDGIYMDIYTANLGFRAGWKNWKKIGYINFDDSVVSESCDHRLHFSHPKSSY